MSAHRNDAFFYLNIGNLKPVINFPKRTSDKLSVFANLVLMRKGWRHLIWIDCMLIDAIACAPTYILLTMGTCPNFTPLHMLKGEKSHEKRNKDNLKKKSVQSFNAINARYINEI